MITSDFPCQYCGQARLRRSRRQSWVEFPKMMLGFYPFRCMACNQRMWMNVWLVSRLLYAKCPKCLRVDVTDWPRKHYRLPFWKNLLITFGARKYRCEACRYNFLSFRPRVAGPKQPPEIGETVETEAAGGAAAAASDVPEPKS